jgi:hypothetical protein
MSTRSIEPSLPRRLLRCENVGDEKIASGGARDARELEESHDRHGVPRASGHDVQRLPRREPVPAREGLRDVNGIGRRQKVHPARAGQQLHLAHGAIASRIHPEDLRDVSRSVLDDGRSRDRRREGTVLPEKSQRASAATGTPRRP